MDYTDKLIAFGERSMEERRKRRREELARDLLLKLVEIDPRYKEHNVRLAIEYTDALLEKLDEEGAQ